MPTVLPALISYDNWMLETKAGITQWRSNPLKDVDVALREYNASKTEENLSDLKIKFQFWANTKEDFTQSIRNTGSEAPWHLHLQLFFSRSSDTQTERELMLMRDEQRDICYQMFRGCNMKLKSKRKTAKSVFDDVKKMLELLGFTGFSVPKMVQDIINKVKAGVVSAISYVKEKTSSILDIVSTVANFVIGLVKTIGVTVTDFISILKDQISTLLENLLLHLIPFASTLKFAKEFGPQVYNLVKKQVTISKSIRARNFLVEGDPKAALNSLCDTLRSERNDMAIDMTTGIIAAATDVFAPAGAQAVKWADDFRKALTNIIRTINNFRQMRAANKIFKSIYVSSFDLSIFKVSPLIACYLISTCTQSQLVAMLPGNTSSFKTWIDYTKSVIDQHIRPLQTEARRIIDGHMCEIEGIGDALREDAINLRKAILKHKELTQAYLPDIHRAAHLSEIRRFDPSRLKATQTKIVDPLQAMRNFELSLRKIDNQMLSGSLINLASFKQETLSTQIITNEQWRKMTWVTFGRRHEFTQAIDQALMDYKPICNRHMKKYTGKQAVVKKEQIATCLKDIDARVTHLTTKIAIPLHKWLNPTNKVHQTSKRLPAMQRLKTLVDTEVSRLSQLHSDYSTKRHEATQLFDRNEKQVA